MKINYFNQPKDVKLGEILCQKFEEKFDSAYIFSGFVKDSGIEYLLNAIENTPIKETIVAIGVDNKNISKDVLIKLLNMGVRLNIFVNNESAKIETRAYAFLKDDGDSYVYLSAAKLSEGGLEENDCLITEIIYSKDENKDIDKLIQKLIVESKFKKVSEEDINELAASGEIMARISERKIPRISELYAKDGVEIGVKEYDESIGSNVTINDFDDAEILVELPDEK